MRQHEVTATPDADGFTITTINPTLNELIDGVRFEVKSREHKISWFCATYYRTVIKFMDYDVRLTICVHPGNHAFVRFNHVDRKDSFDVLLTEFNPTMMERLLNSGPSPTRPDTHIWVDLPPVDNVPRALVIGVDQVRNSTYDINIGVPVTPLRLDINLDGITFCEAGYHIYSDGPKIETIETILRTFKY